MQKTVIMMKSLVRQKKKTFWPYATCIFGNKPKQTHFFIVSVDLQ